MGILPVITACVAVFGAVLGIVNLCLTLWRDRIRLRVEAFRSITTSDGSGRAFGPSIPGRDFVVVVRNLSYMPVTINRVVLLWDKCRTAPEWHGLAAAKRLPERLEARAMSTYHFARPAGAEGEAFDKLLWAKVSTACRVERAVPLPDEIPPAKKSRKGLQ